MIGRRTLFCSAARIGLVLLGAGWTAAARADSTYPGRPARWVVPYTAGGATDVLSRLICQRLFERLGQPFIVENKPGAGSNIGTQAVINSPADGYTLLLTSTANAINASFDPSLPCDFAKVLCRSRGLPAYRWCSWSTINAALADPAILQRLGELGAIAISGDAGQFGAMLTAETDRWRSVVEMSGQRKE